ncbi:DUF4350 domain-containing protein [Tundrisphaera sp. TA3]|uniref:DUF4350 domain-containing protein n=1 Tax=Tundrisphaera sp. TA3 TaxID=3435775 RepID=UPI003EC0B296
MKGRLRFVWLAPLLLAGCGPAKVDESFDRSGGESINGTSALVELFRQRGHEVRSKRSLNGTVEGWADVLVRFSHRPGPPDREEGDRLLDWADANPGRRIIYVPRDYDAGPEFWSAMLAAKAPDAKPEWIRQVERNRDDARARAARSPAKASDPADPEEWFSLLPDPGPPAVATALEGEWAEGVDAAAAAIARHETFQLIGETPLLSDGEGRALAMTWTLDNDSAILVVANASFLLNGALINPARRPLALRVVDWAGDGPKRIAFLDGSNLLRDSEESGDFSVFHLLGIYPFNWIAAHLAVLGLLAALARAVRLGRPLPEPPSGIERPAAHPEALGGLLARTGRADVARDLLDAYRRWRHPSSSPSPPRAHRS